MVHNYSIQDKTEKYLCCLYSVNASFNNGYASSIVIVMFVILLLIQLVICYFISFCINFFRINKSHTMEYNIIMIIVFIFMFFVMSIWIY